LSLARARAEIDKSEPSEIIFTQEELSQIILQFKKIALQNKAKKSYPHQKIRHPAVLELVSFWRHRVFKEAIACKQQWNRRR
jgi:hypothetical protein